MSRLAPLRDMGFSTFSDQQCQINTDGVRLLTTTCTNDET
jgi:hypothetical protein